VDDLRPLADSMGLNAMAPQNDRNAGAGGVLDKVASTARVGAIEFSMLRGHEINKLSQVHVVSKSLYELNRAEPQPWGCLDRRMGISTKKAVCLTCFKQLADCIGHFGHIDLELPVFHIGYIKEVQRVLQATCKTCSRVLLAPLERKHYLQLMNRVEDRKYRAAIANVSSIAPAPPRIRGFSVSAAGSAVCTKNNAAHRMPMCASYSLSRCAVTLCCVLLLSFHDLQQILALCKKVRKCPYCRSFNGAVKKLPGLFRLVHEARTKDAREERAELIAVEFSEAMSANKQLKEHMGKMTHDLTPLVVQALFLRIPDEDCLLLNLDISRGARPEDMIVRQFLVPPACIRPSVTMGTSGSNEDDLTVKIADIIFINNAIKNAIDKGAQPAVIIENC
jgi:DNA-directed RNA polymerase III subunit RPC1